MVRILPLPEGIVGSLAVRRNAPLASAPYGALTSAMREGLQPTRPSTIARLITGEAEARRVADMIGESFEPAETAVAAFELSDASAWSVEVYFGSPPDEAAVRELVALAAGPELASTMTFAPLAEKDWVKSSLDGLKPVRAGHVIVHGSHDRDHVPPNAVALEIEAALAFGTGHHGTTRGCLLAFDNYAKARRPGAWPPRVLDVGTGTGVLALAAARVLRVAVVATDIDADAVAAARANALANRAGAQVAVLHTGQLTRADLVRGGPYGLIFANILMRPLMGLAPQIRRHLAPGGRLILSGLLPAHAAPVVAAYRAQGLALLRRSTLDGWVTLEMALPRKALSSR